MAIQSAAPSEKTLAARRPATFRSVSKRLLGSDWAVAYIFIAPMVLLLFGLIGYPLFLAVKMSMHNFIGGLYDRGFVGLHNYSRLWGDDGYRESVAITIRFAVISVFCKFWLGIAAALLLNRKSTKFRSVFTGLIMLPWIIPEVVAAFAWRGLYNANLGGLNQLLQAFGIIDHNIDWVGEPKRALAAIVAVNVWKGIPFFTIILLAGMKSIDLELYDAAAVDGANGWQRFLNITLPGLRYVIIVACLLSLISTLNSFGLVYLLTGGSNGTKIFSIYTFESINQLRYGVASASALALSPLLVLLIILLGRYIRADFAMQSDNDEAIVRRGRIFTGVSVGVLIALLLTAAEKVGILVISNDVLMFLAIILAVVLALLSGYFLGFNAAIGMGRFAGAFFDIVFWPFLKVFQAFLWVLDLIGMVVDKTIGAVVGGIRRAITGGNTRRETGFHRVSSGLSNTIAHLLILVLVVFELFPFYWMTITAFKSDEQFRSFRSLFWPDPWTFEHFHYMLTAQPFPRWFLNSLQVAVVDCAVSILIGALGAYALVRLRMKGASIMTTLILFTYLMPGVLLVVPLFQIFTKLHLIGHLTSLMIAYPTFGLPFACWLLMGYYRSIPKDLEEAALIDGANHFQAFFRVILPLTLPALLTVGLFAITGTFNEFLFAQLFVAGFSEQLRTLPTGLFAMIIGDIFPYGNMYAASIMMALPITLIYIVAQRFMIEGLTAGSVKG